MKKWFICFVFLAIVVLAGCATTNSVPDYSLLQGAEQGAGKVSSYSAATEVANSDVLVGVDISDTSMAPTGTTKKFTAAVLKAFFQTGIPIDTGITGSVADLMAALTDEGAFADDLFGAADGNAVINLLDGGSDNLLAQSKVEGMTGSATPGLEFNDTDDAAGTATIYGNSSGGTNDIVFSFGVEDSAGENSEYFQLDGVNEWIECFKSINPSASDGAAIGAATHEWSDLFLADGGVIYLGDDQDVPVTHVADTGILFELDDVIQFGDSGVFIGSDDDGYFDVDADTGIRLNSPSIMSSGVTSPFIALRDSSAAGTENTDEHVVKIYGQMSTVTEDGEVGDFRIATVGGSAAGTWDTNIWWDASDEAFYFGVSTDNDAPATVAGSERVKIDFNTSNDNEVTITSDSGLTDIRSTLQITDTKKITADIDNETLTTISMGQVWTNEGDTDGTIFTLPEASTVLGIPIIFALRVAQTLNVNPADGTDTILYGGCSAGDSIQADAIGETITMMAIDNDEWVVLAYVGTWTDAD